MKWRTRTLELRPARRAGPTSDRESAPDRLVAGVGELTAKFLERAGELAGQIGPRGLEGEAGVVAGLAEGAEEGAEIVAVRAEWGAVLVLGEVGVADERADLEDVVGRLAVAQHVEEVDEELHGGLVG